MKTNITKEDKKITKIYEINKKELELLVNIYRNENYELTDEDKKMIIRPPYFNQEGDYIEGLLECISVEKNKLKLKELGKEFISNLLVEYFGVFNNENENVFNSLDVNEAIKKSNEIKGYVRPIQCLEEQLPKI
jgi:hypothetical protein